MNMLSLVPLCILLPGVVFSAESKPVYEVYGDLSEVATMAPRTRGYVTRGPAYEQYKATRKLDNCTFPLDIVIVQDATASFIDDFEQMAKVQVPLMMSTLKASHPGSEFAVVTFQDKPIEPFGNKYDYCQRFDVALTADGDAIRNVYANTSPQGGMDPPENQYGALLGATQADAVKWSTSLDRAQLLVVATDAPPHFDGEYGTDRHGMSAPTGKFDEANMDKQCVTEFYPTPDQVRTSINKRAAYTAFLVYDPEYMSGLVGRSWQWFNRFLNQTDDFITLQAEDSSDFWQKLAGMIGVIEDLECLPDPSTTQEPTATLPASTGPTECPPCPTDCPPCPGHCPPCPVPDPTCFRVVPEACPRY